jgi:hypothetical protein
MATLPGGAVVANWPGAEVVESRAMATQMERLCPLLLGQSALLKSVPGWWCGQDGALAHAEAHFDDLLIAPAFGSAEGLGSQPVVGASLSPERRAALLAAMRQRPMDYVVQTLMALGQTPTLSAPTPVEQQLVPRPFSLRVFAARDGQGRWQVMPGGFARILPGDDETPALIGTGDLSADVCIADAQKQSSVGHTMLDAPGVVRGGAILASQSADNLFWFARYAERAEFTLRLLRALLGGSIEADASPAHQAGSAACSSTCCMPGARCARRAWASPRWISAPTP